MPVSNTHSLHDHARDWRKLVRDSIRGEPTVKRRDEDYLAWPNKPEHPSVEDNAYYKAYKKRAEFKNTVETTRKALVGIPFGKDPDMDLGKVNYLDEDADGSGNDLRYIVKNAISEVLEVNCVGLLAEYKGLMSLDVDAVNDDESNAESQELQQQQVDALGLRASIKTYKAEDIINWRYSVVNGVYQPSLWVLRHTRYDYIEDKFSQTKVDDYLVLSLDENGEYMQELYIGELTEGGVKVPTMPNKTIHPTFNGKRIKEIPFAYIADSGGEPNDSTSYLYPIASKAISDYQVDADFKDHLYKMKPTPWISGLDMGWLTALKEENGGIMPSFQTGGSSAWTLPAGASVGEISASQGADAYFKYKETNKQEQLDLGAKIPGSFDANTATEAMINNAESLANLTDVCEHTSNGVTKVIRWCAQFEGASNADNLVYNINTDFDVSIINPQEVGSLIELYRSQLIDKATLVDNLIKRKFIRTEKEAEDILEAASNEDPTGVALSAALGGVGNQ